MIALNTISRLSAVPCQARDVVSAIALPLESGNLFYTTPVGIVSRVHIIALLISWDGASGMIDDGTGQALIRSGEQKNSLDAISVGSIVSLIARVRSLGAETYLSIESVLLLRDAYWLTYHKYNVSLFRDHATPLPISRASSNLTNAQPSERGLSASTSNAAPGAQDAPSVQEKPQAKTQSLSAQIVETIRLLDSGDGADIDLVLRKLKLEDDSSVQTLIKRGEVYEHKPGKIKILD